MKILLASHIFPPAVDGGSRIIAKIGEYYQSKGDEVSVLTTDCASTDDFVNSQSTPVIVTQTDPFPTHRLPVHKKFRRFFRALQLVFPRTTIWSILKIGPIFKFFPFTRTFIRILRWRPDLIIAGPFPTTIAPTAALIQKILHLFGHPCRLIIVPCFHEYDALFHANVLVAALKSADLICTLTNYEKKYLQHNFHLETGHLYTMSAGIDRAFIKDTNFVRPTLIHSPNILFLGNLAAHKRAEFLIQAFQHLAPRFPRLTLTLAGQPTLFYPQIEKNFTNLPLAIKDRIYFNLKNYNIKELAEYIDNTTILILPSIHESFGLVFIEAMARKKPVIGADIAPVKELILKTGGGLTFKKDDLPDLVKQITYLLTHPTIRRRLSSTGYLYVKNNLTWDTIGKKLCQKTATLWSESSS